MKQRDARWQFKHVLFQNLKQFKVARVEIEKTASKAPSRTSPGAADVGDERRQCGLDGKPAESLDALYATAKGARYTPAMTDACAAPCP